MSQHDDVLGDFLVETYETLHNLDRDLVALEDDRANQALIGAVFRAVHTLKSMAGFLGFAKLERVTHAAETLLVRLRDGEREVTHGLISGLLATVDAVREIMGSVEATSTDGDGDYAPLVDMLERLQAPDAPSSPQQRLLSAVGPPLPPAPPSPPGVYEAAPVADDPLPERLGEMLIQSGRVRIEDVVSAVEAQKAGDRRRLGEILVERAVLRPEDVLDLLRVQQESHGPPLPQRLGDLLVRQGLVAPEDVAAAVRMQVEGDPRRLGEILIHKSGLNAREVFRMLNLQAETTPPQILHNAIRVEAGLIDRLMNQVAVLVHQMRDHQTHCTASDDDLASLVTGLQDILLKIRMQPIFAVWSRYPRFARDLAHSLGKRVRLEMQGKEVQLDRVVIDAIKDALTHLLRNAVDHGIELPAVRMAAGKPPEGCIRLRAVVRDGEAVVEVADDGAGIEPSRIREQVLRDALLAPDEVAELGDDEVLRLILLPGFSMAPAVTHVSGRGMGMDVVRTRVERVGGTLHIDSRPGEGTRFRITIPLTVTTPHARHALNEP